MPKPKPELKLEIRNPEPPKRHNPQPLNARDLDTRTSATEKSQGATTPKTISTALSNRHPAEDTTLDFSYDNMAMNVTPPEQSSATHKFWGKTSQFSSDLKINMDLDSQLALLIIHLLLV